MKTLCKTCRHNCTDNLKGTAPVKNGIWCNAEYGRAIKKKVIECKNYEGKGYDSSRTNR